jgi:hypothetical protein
VLLQTEKLRLSIHQPEDSSSYEDVKVRDLLAKRRCGGSYLSQSRSEILYSKKILRNYPTLSVLRRRPAPSRAASDTFIKKAKNCKGFVINIDDSKNLADSLDNAVIENDPYFNKLLRILSTRCMSLAQCTSAQERVHLSGATLMFVFIGCLLLLLGCKVYLSNCLHLYFLLLSIR